MCQLQPDGAAAHLYPLLDCLAAPAARLLLDRPSFVDLTQGAGQGHQISQMLSGLHVHFPVCALATEYLIRRDGPSLLCHDTAIKSHSTKRWEEERNYVQNIN